MLRFHFDATDSTSTQARRLAAEHPGQSLLVTAAEQTAGRGRHGRTWTSPRGGAWMSFVWPMPRSTSTGAASSLAVGVALRRALVEVIGERQSLQIKWPNDLHLNGRKIAGVLCEQFRRASASDWLIVGIGVNVDFPPESFPPEVRDRATTLCAATGLPIDVERVVDAARRHVVEGLGAFEAEGLSPALLQELNDRLAFVGSRRTWNSPAGDVSGVVEGVDSTGRLVLRDGDRLVTCETGEWAE